MDTEEKSNNLSPVAIMTAVAVVLAVGNYLCTSIHHPEFFQHLTFGRWIGAHKSFPVTDLWTVAGSGKDWHLNSWLFSYSVSLVDIAFGNMGLMVLKVSAFLFFLSVSIVVFARLAGSLFVGALLMVLIASGTLLDVAFGPEILGWGFFLLSLSLTYHFISGKATNSSFCILALVSVIYANLHSSFYLAVLYCFFLVLNSSEVTRGKKVLWLCVMFGAVFATPYLGTQAPSAIYGFINDAWFRFVFQPDPSNVYHYSFSFLLILAFLNSHTKIA